MKNTCLALAIAMSMAAATNSAFAGGFITDILEDTGVISEEEGAALDGMHTMLGNPLDHAAAGAADTFIPGAGTVMELNWEMNRRQHQSGNGAFPRIPQGQNQMMGNRCQTPFGISWPGPWNPLGSPCTFNNSFGYVVQ